MKSILFFLSCTLVTLAVGHAVPSPPHPSKPRTYSGRFDIRTSGQYRMINCGSKYGPQIDYLLQNLYKALLPIIQDAGLSNPSPAFKAFFKDPSNAPFVAEVFTNITTGVARHPSMPPFTNGSPTFICPTAAGQFPMDREGKVTDMYTLCLQSTTSIASYVNPTPYIILCPKFWTSSLPLLPSQNNCLTVSTYNNRFRGNGQTMFAYNMWILFEEIVHYYVCASSKTSLEPEVYDVNKAFRLNKDQAVGNGVSYSYYAASKSLASVKKTLQSLNVDLQVSTVGVTTFRVHQTMGVRYWRRRTQMIHQTKGRIFRALWVSLMALQTCKSVE